MFPLTIHPDTIAKHPLLMVTPNNGSTFGWSKLLHGSTSLQNLCTTINTSGYVEGSVTVAYPCDLTEVT